MIGGLGVGGGGVDLPGYTPKAVDLCLQDFYLEWVHINDGGHLSKGISDDVTWHTWWWELDMMPERRYDAP